MAGAIQACTGLGSEVCLWPKMGSARSVGSFFLSQHCAAKFQVLKKANCKGLKCSPKIFKKLCAPFRFKGSSPNFWEGIRVCLGQK